MLNGKPYCRRCISFKGKHSKALPSKSRDAEMFLSYSLSEEQAEISRSLLANFKNKKNSFVSAICGSGKTEVILSSIYYCLLNGLHVGFCTPRRDVVIEIYERFKKIFSKCTIALIYGGHTKTIQGDLICCTTHQLFRFHRYFDLLVIDEVDAFPFKGDETLNSLFFRAIKGNFIMLSATASEESLQEFKKTGGEVLRLNQRFHRYALPVPRVIYGNIVKILYLTIRLILKFQKINKQVFVFVPTIQESETIYKFVSRFCKNGDYVNSKREKREEIIKRFKQKKLSYLLTTSVLERGVTVKDLQVIVYRADHPVYDEATLVQISGRVGRKKEAPEGEVIYLAKRKTYGIEKSIENIESANKDLQNLF